MIPKSVRNLDFRDHRRELGENRYVYAVVSRRAAGLSIGLNLNPDRVCNFDCPYCQVDRTPEGLAEAGRQPRAVDAQRLEAELDALLAWVKDGSLWGRAPFDTAPLALRRVSDIAFAGDGEPTSSRVFPAAVAAVRRVRDAAGLSATPIRLLTNATLLHRASVRAALTGCDSIWAKLDAGTDAYFQRVDGTAFSFARVLRNLTALAIERPITLQCMFLTLDGAGPTPVEIDTWARRIADIRAAGGHIEAVQVYSVARKPSAPEVGSLSMEALEAIANTVRRAGFHAEVYG
ncbi:MAG: radical SAM protein [Myxococcales bacterium]|nr:radical SAM protein [Myxococcales bacterium]